MDREFSLPFVQPVFHIGAVSLRQILEQGFFAGVVGIDAPRRHTYFFCNLTGVGSVKAFSGEEFQGRIGNAKLAFFPLLFKNFGHDMPPSGVRRFAGKFSLE